MTKKLLTLAVVAFISAMCIAMIGCKSSTGSSDAKNIEITTDADGITNLSSLELGSVYDDEIIDIGMTIDECSKAMGGAPVLLEDSEYGDNIYCYYTKDGQNSICLAMVEKDGELIVNSMSTDARID